MKKVVLAKLTKKEAEKIMSLHANIFTFRTLQNNQFITESEVKECRAIINKIVNEKNNFYQLITEKYMIPNIVDGNYHISPDTCELYIKVYD